jgi:hypothetical protein
MEPVGTIEAWRTNSASDIDETPLVSRLNETAFTSPDATPVLSERTFTLGRRAFEGSVWVPWAFVPAQTLAGEAVSSVGLGAIASGIVIHCASLHPLSATHVMPAPGVFGLINPGQLSVATTPLWDEVGALHLITPGLLPRVLLLPEIHRHFAPEDPTAQRTREALSAIADLMLWLSRSRDDVASICNFSLRASRYWDAGMTPRPGTVRQLLDVRAFVRALVGSIGAMRARAWLDQPGPNGALRIEGLRSPDGITELLREASEVLFVRAPLETIPAPEAAAAAVEAESAQTYQPREFRAPPRRPRRPPARGR